MVLRTCNHVPWKATTGGSDIVGHSEQHSKNPQTTPQGFLLMMRSVTTGHSIETVYVLGERFHHQGATKTQSPEPLSEKAVGTQHCPQGSWKLHFVMLQILRRQGLCMFLPNLSPTHIWLQKLFSVLHGSIFNHPSPCFKTIQAVINSERNLTLQSPSASEWPQ